MPELRGAARAVAQMARHAARKTAVVMPKVVALVLALAWVVARPAPTWAQPAPPPASPASPAPPDAASTARARALFAEGDNHFRLGEYALAIARFKEAYRLAPAPLLLFNLGQAHRLAGDCRQAAWFYDRLAHSGADAEAIARAASPLAAMRACVTRLDAAAGRAPAAARLGRLGWAGLGVGAAGVIAIGIGAGFAYRASDQADRRDAACNDADGCTATEARAFDAAGQRASQLAIGLCAVGGAAVLGGAVMYALGRRAPRVEVAPRAGGATVALGWAL